MEFILSLSTGIDAGSGSSAVRSAVSILRRDMEAVLTGHGARNAITLRQDAALAPQAWRMQVTPDAVEIAHADELGAVYALLHLSEHALGVEPFFFWNDRMPARRETAAIPCGLMESPAYAVRYRGWFVNDEVLLDPWKRTQEERRKVWRMVFETILRCGGNMVIPGTDRAGDGLDLMASDMGLILTQHHAELLGAEMFGRVWPELQGSYRLYPEKFEQLWRAAAHKYKGRKVIYAIGYRGQGDSAFWHEDGAFDTDEKRGAEIERVMRRQMEIVREVSPDAMFCTNLYGEMMQLYRSGALHVPQGVIKIWADNGFGRMLSRRQDLSNPRVDAMPRHEPGENGIYYHAGFYDLQAANHITQLQIPPQDVADELGRVIENGGDTFFIINSGSVKPHIYILDLIRECWTNGRADAQAHALDYARRYFGSEAAAPLLTGYAPCAVRYGVHADDLAGDQYYHHAIRRMCAPLMAGRTEQVRSLTWAETGETVFAQARGFAEKCRASLPKWEAYIARCGETAAQLDAGAALLLRDTLVMNARVHLTGCRMMIAFADAADALQARRMAAAFVHAGRALRAAEEGYHAMRGAEHGQWENYYGNDCFTNLRLTADTLRALRAWIRITGEGPECWDWEQKYLMDPNEVRVRLQLTRKMHLTDEALFERLDALGAWE